MGPWSVPMRHKPTPVVGYKIGEGDGVGLGKMRLGWGWEGNGYCWWVRWIGLLSWWYQCAVNGLAQRLLTCYWMGAVWFPVEREGCCWRVDGGGVVQGMMLGEVMKWGLMLVWCWLIVLAFVLLGSNHQWKVWSLVKLSCWGLGLGWYWVGGGYCHSS